MIGFPCNQFGSQEPGSIEEITTFAKEEYGVTFEIFNKVEVNGEQASPLFEFLKRECPGIFGTEGVKWNFTKFLCDENGTPWKRYGPTVKPEGAILTDLELLLKHRQIGKLPQDKPRKSIFSCFGGSPKKEVGSTAPAPVKADAVQVQDEIDGDGNASDM